MTYRDRASAPHSGRRSLAPWVAAALTLCGLILVTLSIPRPLRNLQAWRDLAMGSSSAPTPCFLFADSDNGIWALLVPPKLDGRAVEKRHATSLIESTVLPRLIGDMPMGFAPGQPVTGGTSDAPWVRYPLLVNGREVWGGSIQVHLDADGDPWILRGRWYEDSESPVEIERSDTDPRLILSAAADWLDREGFPLRQGSGDSLYLGRSLWFRKLGEWHGVREVFAINRDPPGDWLLLVDDRTAEVLFDANRLLHDDTMGPHRGGVSSAATGTGAVFDSNPIAVSGRWDLRWGDDVQSWIVLRQLLHLDGSGWLQGDHVVVKTGDPPRSHEQYLRYLYSNTHPGFDEVMAYYHIDRTVTYLDSLRLLPPGTPPFLAKVHATNLDNSWYRPSTGWLEYGDGGVPDAQDADIIIHELGHAVHDRLVPGFGEGETIALSEGFSDYLACSRTGDPCLGEWDATAYSPPCLRKIDDHRYYPDDLTGRPHGDGLIWASALWEIRSRLGRQLTDVLVLRTMGQTGVGSSFEEAALILALLADEELDSSSARDVRGILEDRGLLKRRATLQLAKDDRLGIPMTFPFPVGDSLSWGLEISGDGGIALRDLPPDGTESQGEKTLVVRPLETMSQDAGSWRLSYDIGTEAATLELTALSDGHATGRATLELLPNGGMLLEWGGEGQGLGGRVRPVLRTPGTEPDTLDLMTGVPTQAPGFVHRSQGESPLAGGLLRLSPLHPAGPAPVWALRWERRPTPPVPHNFAQGARIFASSPSSDDLEVRSLLKQEFTDLLVEIADIAGRRLKRVDIGERPAGLYAWKIPTGRLASGVYWVVLRDGARRLATQRVLVLR